MKCVSANIIAGLALILALLCGCFVTFDITVTAQLLITIFSTVASVLMAVFAGFTLWTARQQKKIQKDSATQQNKIMDEQKNIARKEYLIYKAERLQDLVDLLEDTLDSFHKLINNLGENNKETRSKLLTFKNELVFLESKLKVFYPDVEEVSVMQSDLTKYREELKKQLEEKTTKLPKDLFDLCGEQLATMFVNIRDDIRKIGIELQQLEK